MAGGKPVSKKILIEQIRHTIIDGKSGFFTILTDTKRSIMFRFSEGKLIHSHCRSRKVEDAIAALDECVELTFNYANSQPKDQPELMAAESFLLAISTDEVVDEVSAGPKLLEPVGASTAIVQAVNPALEGEVREIARDYIGVVANILVADVFAKQLSSDETVNEIAASIPIADHAKAFRRRVGTLFLGAQDDETTDQNGEPEHRLFF